MEHSSAVAATGTAGALAAAVAAVAGAAAARWVAVRHNPLVQRHAVALTIATRLACAALMPALQPWAPFAGSGVLAAAAATVLHPEVLLLAATLVLQPLPLIHQLWVQAAEVRSALQRISRQPASAACCTFVGAARRALDFLVADGAPLQPSPLGFAPRQAARCCCMALAWLLLAVGALLPAALALARSQRAAAHAAACQAALLRGTCQSGKSSPTSCWRGSLDGSHSNHSPGSDSNHSPGSSSPAGGGSPEGDLRGSAAGSPLLPKGSPASSGGSAISSLEALARASSEPAGLQPNVRSWAAASRSASSGAALERGGSEPPSLTGLLRSTPKNGSPDPSVSGTPRGGQSLAGLPAALLSAPLPLSYVQCLLLLLPAGAALWAALEVALDLTKC